MKGIGKELMTMLIINQLETFIESLGYIRCSFGYWNNAWSDSWQMVLPEEG